MVKNVLKNSLKNSLGVDFKEGQVVLKTRVKDIEEMITQKIAEQGICFVPMVATLCEENLNDVAKAADSLNISPCQSKVEAKITFIFDDEEDILGLDYAILYNKTTLEYFGENVVKLEDNKLYQSTTFLDDNEIVISMLKKVKELNYTDKEGVFCFLRYIFNTEQIEILDFYTYRDEMRVEDIIEIEMPKEIYNNLI